MRPIPEQIRELLDARAASCTCGYSLWGLNCPRCPECGRRIVDLLKTADLHPERLPTARRQALLRLIVRKTSRTLLLVLVIVVIAASIVFRSSIIAAIARLLA